MQRISPKIVSSPFFFMLFPRKKTSDGVRHFLLIVSSQTICFTATRHHNFEFLFHCLFAFVWKFIFILHHILFCFISVSQCCRLFFLMLFDALSFCLMTSGYDRKENIFEGVNLFFLLCSKHADIDIRF